MFGKKFIEKKIDQAGHQAVGGDQPLDRASEMAAKFGIHLDLADAVGATPADDPAEALKNGHVRGSLHIVSCTALDPRELRAPCHMNYVVQSPGIPAFAGEQVFEVWTKQWPSPGDDLPVIFDPSRPEKLKIQWGELPSHADSAKLHAQQLAAQLNAGAVPGAAPRAQPMTVTPIVVGSADPEQIRQALLRAEQTLGIDLNGDGKIGTD
jgi:hypothetical protein